MDVLVSASDVVSSVAMEMVPVMRPDVIADMLVRMLVAEGFMSEPELT